ncbi:MAG TPA: hypothetical protein VHZ51_22985 [Ktedonobacteraceae bacterium]|nr:hypothetical protein [Ktedonobacteraceae bacterium]
MESCPTHRATLPFSLTFAKEVVPIMGDETGGASTESETSNDGVVKKDSEEDADVTE